MTKHSRKIVGWLHKEVFKNHQVKRTETKMYFLAFDSFPVNDVHRKKCISCYIVTVLDVHKKKHDESSRGQEPDFLWGAVVGC